MVAKDLLDVLVSAAMRAAHVRPGGPLYPAKRDTFKALGGRQFFWEANDPAILPPSPVLPEMRRAGWWVGTVRDPSWTQPKPSAVTFAHMLDQDLTMFAGYGVQHSTVIDIEWHDARFVLDVMREFRRLRPARYLYWTFEPFQGGWITDELAAWVNSDPFTWAVPQLYFGEGIVTGERACSERAVLTDLVPTGLHDDKVKAYYDRFEHGWEGVLYDWTNIAAQLP